VQVEEMLNLPKVVEKDTSKKDEAIAKAKLMILG
ncbi:hypothetical protein BD31_I1821, partial [Candidatus Nitrosopumilus salaria BD31]